MIEKKILRVNDREKDKETEMERKNSRYCRERKRDIEKGQVDRYKRVQKLIR